MAKDRRNNRWTSVVSKNNKKHEDDEKLLATNNETPKSKSARRNERRKERKRLGKLKKQQEQENAQQQQQPQDQLQQDETNLDYNELFGDEVEEETITRAMMVSLENSNNNGTMTGSDQRLKRLRKLRKKLSEARALSNKQEPLEEEQQFKVDQIPMFEAEIRVLEDELETERLERLEEDRREKEAREKAHRERIAEWTAFSNGNIVKGFGGENPEEEDEFACPLCAGPFEAAVRTQKCGHVFCRACLEDSLSSAAERSGGDPESIVCPMCRTCQLDPSTLRVTVEPAYDTRRKMKKKRCVCRCGTEMSLASLRIHLRTCAEGAPILFGEERKRFGHEFEQPKLDPVKVKRWCGVSIGGETTTRSHRGGVAPQGYDEEAEIQAAILLSLAMVDA